MKSKMRTARADVVRNERKIDVPNSSWIGYSRGALYFGDFFTYSQDGRLRLARYHGQIRPVAGGPWRILAQVASDFVEYTYERWIDPRDVLETRPGDVVRPEIVAVFNQTINCFSESQNQCVNPTT